MILRFLNLQDFFFDGDVGNMLYMFGIFGTFITLSFISLKLLRSGYFNLLLYLSPFLMGGGILGNQKFAFIFILLTLVHLSQTKRRSPKVALVLIRHQNRVFACLLKNSLIRSVILRALY